MMRRRKGFYTLLIILSFLCYFNWYVNINDWKNDADIRSHLDLDDSNKNLAESVHAYKIIDFSYKTNQNFVLISVKNSILHENGKLSDKSDELSKNEFEELLALLYKNRAFLTDFEIFKAIKLKDNNTYTHNLSVHSDNNVYSIDKFNSIFEESENPKSVLLKFGIFLNSFESIYKVILDH